MRILEFINTLGTGGAEHVVASLALSLRESGHHLGILCLRELEPEMAISIERFRDLGVSIAELHKTDGFSWNAVSQVTDYLRRWKPDVLHCHNHLVSHYGALGRWLSHTPVLVQTIHGLRTLDLPLRAHLAVRASCSLSDAVVGVCEPVCSTLRGKYRISAEKTIAIPNGIDLSPLLDVRRPPSDRNEFVFGTIGRLDPIKDHHSLLQAFASVHRSYPMCHLKILGYGDLMSDLKAFAVSLGVAQSVTFEGWSSDVAGFLSGVDCFVLSSLSEGLPLTLLEAMAAGVPIVATNVGGVPDIVRRADCGWLAAPGQPEALANAMTAAMTALHLSTAGSNARNYAVRHHSVQTMAASYEQLFEELLRRRGCVTRTPTSIPVHSI